MPDKKKTMLFAAFVLIMIGGLVQRAPLIESPPQPMPSLLGDFSLTLLASLLSLPYLVITLGLTVTLRLYNFTWLVIVGNVIYLYFLSCLSVSCVNRYNHRFSKWHWTAIIGIPLILVALYAVRLDITSIFIDDLLNYLGMSLIASLYLYLLFCLGFSVYDAVIKRK